jgi:ankyrin repeat protein
MPLGQGSCHRTALEAAMFDGTLTTVRLLLVHGADPNTRDENIWNTNYNETPLRCHRARITGVLAQILEPLSVATVSKTIFVNRLQVGDM